VIAPFGCKWCDCTFILLSEQIDFKFIAAFIDNNEIATNEFNVVGVVCDLLTHLCYIVNVDVHSYASMFTVTL